MSQTHLLFLFLSLFWSSVDRTVARPNQLRHLLAEENGDQGSFPVSIASSAGDKITTEPMTLFVADFGRKLTTENPLSLFTISGSGRVDVLYSQENGLLYVLATVANLSEPSIIEFDIRDGITTDDEGATNQAASEYSSYAPSSGYPIYGYIVGWTMFAAAILSLVAVSLTPTVTLGVGVVNFIGFVQVLYMIGNLPLTNMPWNYRQAAQALDWVGLNPSIGPIYTDYSLGRQPDIYSSLADMSIRFPRAPVRLQGQVQEDAIVEESPDVSLPLQTLDSNNDTRPSEENLTLVVVEEIPLVQNDSVAGQPPANPFLSPDPDPSPTRDEEAQPSTVPQEASNPSPDENSRNPSPVQDNREPPRDTNAPSSPGQDPQMDEGTNSPRPQEPVPSPPIDAPNAPTVVAKPSPPPPVEKPVPSPQVTKISPPPPVEKPVPSPEVTKISPPPPVEKPVPSPEVTKISPPPPVEKPVPSPEVKQPSPPPPYQKPVPSPEVTKISPPPPYQKPVPSPEVKQPSPPPPYQKPVPSPEVKKPSPPPPFFKVIPSPPPPKLLVNNPIIIKPPTINVPTLSSLDSMKQRRKLMIVDPVEALGSSGFSYTVVTATPETIGNQYNATEDLSEEVIGSSVLSRIRTIQNAGNIPDADQRRLDVLWNVLFWSAMAIVATFFIHGCILLFLRWKNTDNIPKMLQLPRIELVVFMVILPMICAAGCACLQSTSAGVLAAGVCFGVILPFGYLIAVTIFLIFAIVTPNIEKRRALYIVSKDHDTALSGLHSNSDTSSINAVPTSATLSIEQHDDDSGEYRATLDEETKGNSTMKQRVLHMYTWIYKKILSPLFGFSSPRRADVVYENVDASHPIWHGPKEQDSLLVKRFGCFFEDAHGPQVLQVKSSKLEAKASSGKENIEDDTAVYIPSTESNEIVEILQTFGVLFALTKLMLFAAIINAAGGVNNVGQVVVLLILSLLHILYLRLFVPYRLRIELAAEITASVCDLAVFICGIILIAKDVWTTSEGTNMGVAMLVLQAVGFLVFITVRVGLALRTLSLTLFSRKK